MPPPRRRPPSAADAAAIRRPYLRLVALSSTLRHLDQILAVSLASGHYPLDPASATSLLLRYASLRAPHGHLLRLFRGFPRPDRFLRNALLRSLPSLRPRLLFPCPDSFSFAFAATSLAASCSRGGGAASSSAARALHALAVAAGYAADTFVASALAKLYFVLSRVDHARKVFDMVPSPDTVLWNTLLAGLSGSEAVESFARMVGDGSVRPDATTLASVLPAVAEVADVTMGRCVHSFAEKCGLADHEHVLTGLISLYSKCGDVESARCLFDMMEKPDLVAYNALISGYSVNGMVGSSVDLFTELMTLGLWPNSSTLVALIPVHSPFGHDLLAQCLHGFVLKSGFTANSPVSTAITTLHCRLNDMESARKAFDAMPEKTMESWNAMISGYAQNGLTEMAVALFEQMLKLNVRPNPITISSTLSACAQLGALSLGKWLHRIIAEEDLEPNQYSEAAVVRQEAKSRKLVKTPGYTLIEISNKPHVFMAGDRAHPQSEAIYSYLEKLTAKMIEAGYRPETEAALYDVEEEEKEHMVKVHSEKLAIAFGLLSTEPGTEIRIIKNLRVCLDCHNATKFISKVTQRLIVVRDASRFHHFRDGVCSCGDYW
ncbi:hypothetical protein OsI_21946 [Oryza sativa Indica Group]|uniref:DYW domain-containing protein n=1 Tax=Oryza sativa subsp. indica TaxID=39946 RepID=B8B3Q8_ORYSI|nr:hypothetical protein OsI_21946 [Oryza sativa Indica Group]